MTRMIERWFPCDEVSRASQSGWGTGYREASMFTWFAKRPLAQARAAVLTSLLPWPDDPAEQRRLQSIVRLALTDYDGGQQEVVDELAREYPLGASVLDPFAGRAMIPLEAARYGVKARGIDYSPVATLAGKLLAEYPLRDWSDEPPLPFQGYRSNPLQNRLLQDVEFVVGYAGERITTEMAPYFPKFEGTYPWGYLWAVSVPCQFCSKWFPLIGSLALRKPHGPTGVIGQSFRLDVVDDGLVFEVHPGPPTGLPTLVSKSAKRGKLAICPFCTGSHEQDTLRRLMKDGLRRDTLLLAADADPRLGKSFRPPTPDERAAIELAEKELANESPFGTLPAVPTEPTPPGLPILPAVYGYKSYGDLCCARQTLAYVKTCRVVNESSGASSAYVECLTGYLAAVIVRKLRRSTRGACLEVYSDGRPTGVKDVFTNESSIAFNFDFIEVGLGQGAGSWESVASRTLATLRDLVERTPLGRSATIGRGTATALPFRANSMTAVVTDPPYDAMIYYSDASDLFFAWLKRALIYSHADLLMTAAADGLQDKREEVIVREHKTLPTEHRNREHYDRLLAKSFSEAARVVASDGVVTIVFGHGEPEVWHRLLTAISEAGLVLTGSWPARTEKGGKAGTSNIVTTLTLACRPAPPIRQAGRVGEVDAEVRREINARLPLWSGAGLALTDQLMASAGPAMEVVGRYSEVRDKVGKPVSLDRYLPLARQMVQEAADIRIDDLPLETFDERTRFALFWTKIYGRSVAPGSEARWQRLAADLDDEATERILTKSGKGIRLSLASEVALAPEEVEPTTSVIDVVMAMVADGKSLARSAEVLLAADRVDDPYVWAAVRALSDAVPEADPDGEAWTYLVRNRQAVVSSTHNVAAVKQREGEQSEASSAQGKLDLGDA
jgi:putative DNA methylase